MRPRTSLIVLDGDLWNGASAQQGTVTEPQRIELYPQTMFQEPVHKAFEKERIL